MRKKMALLLAVICLLLPLAANAGTVENARVLYDLGLLKGTGTEFSEAGLELARNATRTEICITVVRMLGKEQKVDYQQNAHPFSDIPAWGANAVGWLYENYLVNGVSDTYFGAQDIATVQQFATMLLRVLGYNDAAGDFSYENASAFAVGVGLLDEATAMKWELSRSDMMDMCYKALRLPIKNSKRLLIQKLCEEGAVDSAEAAETGILTPPSVSDAFASVPENLGDITVHRENGFFRIQLLTPLEHYGVRVFIQEKDGGGVIEVKYDGLLHMEKGKIEYIGGGDAGYIREIFIYGLDESRAYEFIVVKTTSEDALYLTTGKSKAVWG